MKKIFLLLIIAFGGATMNAQQDYHFSQFMYSQLAINPGSAGSNEMICASLIQRYQWAGMDNGAPTTFAGGIDAPFKLFGIKSGAGIFFTNDQIGFNKDQSVKFSYAFRVDAGSGKLGIGFNVGVQDKGISDAEWMAYNSESGLIESVPGFPGEENVINVDGGVGLFYKTEDVYLGLSATHIAPSTFDFEGESSSEEKNTLSYKNKTHYFLTAGYRIQMNNPLFEFLPAMMLYSDGRISQLVANATIQYNKKIWGGISYRVGSAIIGMVGFEPIKDVQLGYAYDFEVSDLGRYFRNSHEIMLRYCFSLSVDKLPKKYKSVRFL
ncbi:MAG: PorP/SprF family type IX secretion system membrane protein [Bacteroidota bacterium]